MSEYWGGMPASYDAWATAGPPEYEWVCPSCGETWEDMEEVDTGQYKCACGWEGDEDQVVESREYWAP